MAGAATCGSPLPCNCGVVSGRRCGRVLLLCWPVKASVLAMPAVLSCFVPVPVPMRAVFVTASSPVFLEYIFHRSSTSSDARVIYLSDLAEVPVLVIPRSLLRCLWQCYLAQAPVCLQSVLLRAVFCLRVGLVCCSSSSHALAYGTS